MMPIIVAMEAQSTALIVLLLTFAAHYSLAFEICEEGLRTRVRNGTVEEDGSLQAEDGTVYPNGTFWQEDDFHWACPCLSGPCVRICAMKPSYLEHIYFIAEILTKDFDNATFYLDAANNFETDVWENEYISKKVPLNSLFKLVQLENDTKECTAPGSQAELNLRTQLFQNGSFQYFYENFTMYMVHYPDQFCLFPIEWDDTSMGIICVENYETFFYLWLHPICFVTSIFFLFLTLIALHLSDKGFKSLHAKLLVHHCVSLICYDLVLLIFVTTNYDGVVCAVIAYLTYYFIMAACFWLNVMCYEIYSTFKCGYGKHNLKFKCLALYGWGCPLVLTLIAFLMQNTLPLDHVLNPKFGYSMSCFFSEEEQMLIYYEGPTIVLLLSNVVLFVMTAVSVRRLRRESSAALSTDDSQVHQDEKRSSKSRLSMYLKLFLLMGCTWILEFIPSLFNGLHGIWIYVNAFNFLRGVFVFWINVISNPSVRKVIQDKMLKLVPFRG